MTTKTTFLKYDHTMGLSTMEGRGYYYPVDSAIADDGKIYTVSRSLDGDVRGVRVSIDDWDEGFHGTFAGYGEDAGGLVWPTAIAIDGEGKFYIADEHTNRITVYSSDGKYDHHWGELGSGDDQIDGPSGLAFDADDNLFVVDHQNNRIVKVTKSGTQVSSFGEAGSGDGQFNLPWGIAIDSSGNIHVSDWANDRVQKFSSDGAFIATFGSSGSGDGQFNKPAGVAVDSDGNIYVADWGNERVQVLDSDGGFVASLRGEATDSAQANDFLRINIEEAAARASSDLEPNLDFMNDPHEESWHVEKYFWAPTGVTIDNQDRLYVTESNRHRLQMYVRA